MKEENDKKKEYIQQLAQKYQSIIEDLKSQLQKTSNSQNTQIQQENLKLRKVIKKMDEEITLLQSKQFENSETDMQGRIDALERENERLKREIENLEPLAQNSKILDRERQMWAQEKLIIEKTLKERLTMEYETRERNLKQ